MFNLISVIILYFSVIRFLILMHINNTFSGGRTSSASNARQNTGSSLNGTANSATEDEQTHEVYLCGSASLPPVIYDKIHKVTFSKNLHIYMACVN
jgi:hypothetical protein